MATGYAAVTGRPQVVLLHAAAGLLQGANAIHGALLTGAPVVVCSGESAGYGDAAGPDPGSQWYRNLSVVGGPQGVAAPFTKWACAAADVSVLYGMVKRAGELAAQAPAGPVYVNTPVETLLARWRPSSDRQARPFARPDGGGPARRRGGGPADRRREEPGAGDGDGRARSGGVRRPGRAGRAARAAGGRAAVGALLELPADQSCCTRAASSPPLAAEADLVILLGCRAPWYPPSAKPGDGDRARHRRDPAPAAHRLPGPHRRPVRRRRDGGDAAGADRRDPRDRRRQAAVAARRQRLAEAHLDVRGVPVAGRVQGERAPASPARASPARAARSTRSRRRPRCARRSGWRR